MTAERLREVIVYDPDTGEITWRKTRGSRALAGSVAGSVSADGYRKVMIDGRLHLAHRLAWLYVTGEVPEGQVFHANGDRNDNAWSNLRNCVGRETDGVTAHDVRSAFDYNPDTGEIAWKVRPHRRSAVRPGDKAGCLDSYGYLQIKYMGVCHLGHRLIWLYMTGAWPTDQIDHRNGDKADNRWVNLRCVSAAVNSQNRKTPRAGRKYDLPMCVYTNENNLRTLKRPYQAKVGINGKYISGGFFSTPEQAAEKAEKMRISMSGYVHE